MLSISSASNDPTESGTSESMRPAFAAPFTRARTSAGAAEVASLHEEVLSMYKAAGGQLDFWAVDDESSSVMHSCVICNDVHSND